MNDDTPSDDNWRENLANLGKAIGPFLPRFRNLRKVRDRLLGDVSEAAFDALVSRLHLYQTLNQAEAIKTVVERSGLPPSIAHEMVSRQEAIDTLVADALGRIAHDGKPNTGPTAEAETSGATSDDEWFDVYRREAADRSAGEMREAFVRAARRRNSTTGDVFRADAARTRDDQHLQRQRSSAVPRPSACHTSPDDARIPAVGGKARRKLLGGRSVALRRADPADGKRTPAPRLLMLDAVWADT